MFLILNPVNKVSALILNMLVLVIRMLNIVAMAHTVQIVHLVVMVEVTVEADGLEATVADNIRNVVNTAVPTSNIPLSVKKTCFFVVRRCIQND